MSQARINSAVDVQGISSLAGDSKWTKRNHHRASGKITLEENYSDKGLRERERVSHTGMTVGKKEKR